jgi:hypothetical protein
MKFNFEIRNESSGNVTRQYVTRVDQEHVYILRWALEIYNYKYVKRYRLEGFLLHKFKKMLMKN